jgi:hypothetical protein
LFCRSFLQKGEGFTYVGRNENLTDLHGGAGALVLFLCGYIHCWIMNFLLWKSATLPSPFYSKA